VGVDKEMAQPVTDIAVFLFVVAGSGLSGVVAVKIAVGREDVVLVVTLSGFVAPLAQVAEFFGLIVSDFVPLLIQCRLFGAYRVKPLVSF